MGKGHVKTITSLNISEKFQSIYDYGKLYKSIPRYLSVSPNSIEEAVELVKYTYKENIDIRFRGSGHTFNGVTLPKAEEILVHTQDINHYKFEDNKTLTVGAGAIMWDVRDLARDFGYDLFVYNGGWAGPSVGGYINAGGIGKGNLSSYHGGLWESINYIKIIDAFGNIHTINKSDERFPWIFGSFGQLGFLVEANFKLRTPTAMERVSFLLNGTARMPDGIIPKQQSDDPTENLAAPIDEQQVLFWYSMFIKPEQSKSAWADLFAWVNKHDILIPEGGWNGPILDGHPIGYHYNIKYFNFHPPLIFPHQTDFYTIGVMSRADVSDQDNVDRIMDIESDFIKMAKDGDYKLYLQAENFGQLIDFKEYYGDRIYNQFRKLKEGFDPTYRINRGVFFKNESV